MAWNLAPCPLSTVTPMFQGLESLPAKVVHGVLSKNTRRLEIHQSFPLCKATQSEGTTEESSSTGINDSFVYITVEKNLANQRILKLQTVLKHGL